MSFGGAPRCPTCDKAVYHAEQTIGPGRKVYHKPCLKCQHCGKVLSPVQMVEHDQQPWCKRCHTAVLGTRDLRSGNVLPSPSPSPARARTSPPPAPPAAPDPSSQASASGSGSESASRLLPLRPAPKPAGLGVGGPSGPVGAYDDFVMPRYTARGDAGAAPGSGSTAGESTSIDVFSAPASSPAPPSGPSSPSPPITTTTTTIRPNFSSLSPRPLPRSTPAPEQLDARGLLPSPRAKVGSPLGGGGETCEACGKRVYFAEGINALSRRWHKACLRCTACKTTLSDSGKVADRGGEPYCRNCYHRLFGPPGIIGR